MELRHIKYFLAVAEEQNITKASEKICISQPPLSRALMDLEYELNCKLFIRGKRRITLTEEGLALKRRGEQLLALAEMTKSEITEIKNGISGTLHLGHVDSNGPSLAAQWISSFKKKYPTVTYNLWCGNVDDLTDRMKAGLIDLAITMTPMNTELLNGIKVYSENWVAIIPPGHKLAQNRKKSVSIEELIGNDLIISSRKSREEEIREWFKSTNGKPHFVVKTAHSSNAAKLVEQDIGIALFPASVAKNVTAGSEVVIKKITPEKTVEYYLSWIKEKSQSLLAQKFVQHVQELVGEEE